jgi:large subunit ribosomal protein L25
MELIAEKRKKLGKENKGLRAEGYIPAVIFGKNMESLPITLKYADFSKVWNESGETDLIDVKVSDGEEKGEKATKGEKAAKTETYKILIKNVTYGPVSDKIIHAEFYKPDLTVKTEAQIPVEVIGEEANELIKTGEAMVFYVVDEITVKALPMDLPHAFVIDIAKITQVGEAVLVSQLEFNREKVEIVDLEAGEPVIRLDKVEAPVEEEEVAPVSEAEAVAAVEATKEKVAEEGEEEDGEGGKDGKDKGGRGDKGVSTPDKGGKGK